MKKLIIILIPLFMFSRAYAEPEVYLRNPDVPSSVAPGRVSANGQSELVVLNTFGTDAIEQARRFGRLLADENLPVPNAIRDIKSQAEKLYRGNQAFMRFFEGDASRGYDERKLELLRK